MDYWLVYNYQSLYLPIIKLQFNKKIIIYEMSNLN